MKTFIKAIKKILSNVSDEMLEALFLKVDTDCNGSITWEYVDYVMRELQRRERMRTSQYRLHFHLPMRIIPLNHGCEIVKVQFLTQRFKKMGHLLTVTKDGILQIWSESFSLLNSFRLNQIHQPYNQQMWVTDMVCLHNMNLIAIASTDQKIEFFDITNHNCARAFTFIDLDSCVLTMDYWSDYHRGVFCYGDTKGNVIVFTSDNVTHGLFNPRILPRTSKWDHWTKVSTRKLLNEKSPLYRSYWLKIGILKGYLETEGPEKTRERTTTYSTPLCAVLYTKIFKQVVSGCLSSLVSVWEIKTGKRMMEFSVTGDQQVELTTMCLDESERCLLTGLRDGTIKMWNYTVGECLLTFPNPDQLEISGIVHMNKVFYVTGWSKRITCFMLHETKPVLLYYQWQSFHKEDVLSMAKYQNQFLGTSSYNGDILFWNINLFKPILNFNASKSPWPLLPKKIQEVDNSLAESLQSSKLCVEHKEWAYKPSTQPLGPRARAVANANLQRNLMSAPPVMKRPRDKEPEKPMSPQVGAELSQKHVSSQSPKLLRMPHGKQSIIRDAQRKRGEFQKKILLQSNTSVEKIIFLQTRPRLPHIAALLSSCIDGYIYAWSIHGSGGLLGKFPVDFKNQGDVGVGAMATDEKDLILVTGDCKGHIKIWDIEDYCTFTDKTPLQPRGTNKFQFLIPEQVQIHLPHYIPLKEKEVVAGQTISLVPPKLLNAWKGHLDSVADILYVDSFQLIISAGHDCDVKAWKLSGDTIGTFGVSVWKRLQDIQMVGDLALRKSSEEADSIDAAQKAFRPELQEEQALAEALVYQRREQVALMALLNGKADAEAEAWGKLQRITQTSPWAGEHYSEDVEHSWLEWESKGKQVSKIVGGAYKPKDRSRSPGVLSTNVQYGWMKHQISPQIYQSLHFNQLSPTHTPDFLVHNILGHHGQHIYLVTHKSQKDLNPEETNSSTASVSPSDTLTPKASGSRFLESALSTSPYLQPSPSLLSQPSRYVTQRSAPPMPVASSIKLLSRPLKAAVSSSMKKSHRVRF
ncbi:EF-hand calcium-binding domain-containing protein 8 isoform X3 [Vulpes lagopus]|uniref:EF-hand calcium-binding domain-containing protein 8 isoform X3 n=1 Tax=Vulpes lagopus TaxID=494514 RepID=UPI001BC9A766|nr:EF-hand calcium-binding domain-containing protein 8 isoform X3 [Vulpes lagopus]